jgi:hypothetical protein
MQTSNQLFQRRLLEQAYIRVKIYQRKAPSSKHDVVASSIVHARHTQ